MGGHQIPVRRERDYPPMAFGHGSVVITQWTIRDVTCFDWQCACLARSMGTVETLPKAVRNAGTHLAGHHAGQDN